MASTTDGAFCISDAQLPEHGWNNCLGLKRIKIENNIGFRARYQTPFFDD